MIAYDVLIIGGGMAGVSVARELASDRSVGLLEMEPTLAYHTTGRSAAVFIETYGPPEIRILTAASRAFLEDPPDTFESRPLRPIGYLQVAPAGRGEALRRLHREVVALTPDARLVGPDAVTEVNPALRPGYAELGLVEPGAREIDVHAVHQGYLRGLRRRGGEVHVGARLVRAERAAGVWTVTTGGGERYQAPLLVDAAGAWADEVADMAGAAPVGIRSLRRTIFIVAAPPGLDPARVPMTTDTEETFYFKPEGAGFLCSPADKTPQPPGDARPDETEIARALDTLADATILGARHVGRAWAGLRSFAPDGLPVVGFDPRAEGFLWLAGQGGYGIQSATAMARCAAALARGDDLPQDVSARGLTAAAIGPARPGLAGSATAP